MSDFLKLIRFPNLIIVGLTQCLIYFFPFKSGILFSETDPILTIPLFFLLSFATILIAASGYVINDIVDYEMDLINKPEKVIVGRSISPQTAQSFYFFLIVLGFLASAYIAFQINNFYLLSVYPLAVGLLYFYSTSFKKKPFLGNLVVALFCAFVPGILLIPDWQTIPFNNDEFIFIGFVLFYMFFAFITTLIREVVKDIEDIEGDRLYNCQTIPILYGQKAAIRWAVFLMFTLIIGLLIFQGLFIIIPIIFFGVLIFTITFLFLPSIYILFRLFKAKQKHDFTYLSKLIKGLMLLGLVYLIGVSIILLFTLIVPV